MTLEPPPVDHSAQVPAAPKAKTDQPCCLVPNHCVVAIYNARHPNGKQLKNVRKQVKVWFENAAKEAGWTKVTWYPEYNAPRGYAALLIYKHQETTPH